MCIEDTIKRIMAKCNKSGEEVSYSCNKCKDTSWIIEDGMARRCSCYEVNRVKRLWESSGVSPEQREKTFGTFKVNSEQSAMMKSKAIAYYKGFDHIKGGKHNSIAFLGQVGSGKSHLCFALAVNFLEKGIPVVYMPFRDVIMDMKINILDEEFYRRSVERYQRCEVLFIDDLFKGKITGSDCNIMFEIVNYRYLNRKPMIISSERGIGEMLEVDEGIGSRIYEMCREFIVEVRGSNYRMR